MSILSEVRDGWGWIGIEPIKIVDENDFGNLIILDNDGRFWRLCPEDGYCEVVAQNQSEWNALKNDKEFVLDWEMSVLVNIARTCVGPLKNGSKYHLVIPGFLGGAYDASNIKSVPHDELIGFSGSIARQIQDLPDGSQIRLKITD